MPQANNRTPTDQTIRTITDRFALSATASHYHRPLRTFGDRFALSATASHFQRPFRTITDRFAPLPTVSHYRRPLRTFGDRGALVRANSLLAPIEALLPLRLPVSICLCCRIMPYPQTYQHTASHLWRPLHTFGDRSSHLRRRRFRTSPTDLRTFGDELSSQPADW